MGFLGKLAAGLLKGVAIVSGFQVPIGALSPKAGSVIATVQADLNQIAGIITTVEVVGQVNGLTGAQKLTGAAPLVEQIVLSSSLLVGHKIADEAKFKAACAGIASNMADLLNSLHADAIDVKDRT